MDKIPLILLVAIVIPVMLLDTSILYLPHDLALRTAVNNIHTLQITTHALLISIILILLTRPARLGEK